MLINFRQGIINAQINNNHLQLVDGGVNINVNIAPIDLAFAYGSHDYLFTESENVISAWSGFSTTSTTYLFWDINTTTGIRTFGTTMAAPGFGTDFPTSPVIDQCFFDYSNKTMNYWNGRAWSKCLRVFAGYVDSATVLTTYPLGSQVNLVGQTTLGYIIYDVNQMPFKSMNASDNYFLTTVTDIHTQKDYHNNYRLDSLLIDGQAIEPIPSYHCVTWKGPKKLGVASYSDYTRPCIGISVSAYGKNEVKPFITKGFLTNYNNWNFTEDANTPLFVGIRGEITSKVPQQYSLQQIGHIVSPDTIYIDIQNIVLIDNNPRAATPTPTITPSLTPEETPLPS